MVGRLTTKNTILIVLRTQGTQSFVNIVPPLCTLWLAIKVNTIPSQPYRYWHVPR